MNDFHQQMIDLVSEADNEAHVSSLAWQLGPKVFRDHLENKVDAIEKRIREQYDAIANSDGQSGPEVDPFGDSGSGSWT